MRLNLVCLFLVTAALVPLAGHAAAIHSTLPAKIDAQARYVFYSHGRIVEGEDEKPVSPDFGEYDFPAIRRALFEGGGFELIAFHRPKGADTEVHVAMLERWVRQLVSAGVKPGRITLIGFSRGGYLTAQASSRLRDLGINTAIIAVCRQGDVADDPPVILGGNVISIYERSDDMGSCSKVGERGPVRSFQEISIQTGRRHGAFYQPLPEWITPLKAWIAGTNR